MNKITSLLVALSILTVFLVPVITADGEDYQYKITSKLDDGGAYYLHSNWKYYLTSAPSPNPWTDPTGGDNFPYLSWNTTTNPADPAVYRAFITYTDNKSTVNTITIHITGPKIEITYLNASYPQGSRLTHYGGYTALTDGSEHNLNFTLANNGYTLKCDGNTVITYTGYTLWGVKTVTTGVNGLRFEDMYDLQYGELYFDDVILGNSTAVYAPDYDSQTDGVWFWADQSNSLNLPPLNILNVDYWKSEVGWANTTTMPTWESAYIIPHSWNYNSTVSLSLDPDDNVQGVNEIFAYFENATSLQLDISTAVFATATHNHTATAKDNLTNYYYILNGTDATEMTSWDSLTEYSIYDMINAGYIDGIHTLGYTGAGYMPVTNTIATGMITKLNTTSKTLLYYSNHGSASFPQAKWNQYGGNASVDATKRMGDDPTSAENYTLDLMRNYGVRYFWGNEQSDDGKWASLDNVDLGWYGQTALIDGQGQATYSDTRYSRLPSRFLLQEYLTIDNGTPIMGYAKPLITPSTSADQASEWDTIFTTDILDALYNNGSFYAPTTHFRDADTDTDVDGTPDWLEGLHVLSAYRNQSKINVMSHAHALEYSYYMNYLNYTYNATSKVITLNGIDAPQNDTSLYPTGISLDYIDELYLTWKVPDAQNTSIKIGSTTLNTAYNQTFGKIVILPYTTNTGTWTRSIECPIGAGDNWTYNIQLPTTWTNYNYITVKNSTGATVSYTQGSVIFDALDNETYTIEYNSPIAKATYNFAAVAPLLVVVIFMSVLASLVKKNF